MRVEVDIDQVAWLNSEQWMGEFGKPFKWIGNDGSLYYYGGMADNNEYRLIDGEWRQIERRPAQYKWAE